MINKVSCSIESLDFFNDSSLYLDVNLIKTELTNTDDMVDIDERLKSLEKFMKDNLPS